MIVKTDGQWNVCSSSAELQQGIWGNPVRYHLPPHITTGLRSALPERKGDVKKVTLVEKAPLTFYKGFIIALLRMAPQNEDV